MVEEIVDFGHFTRHSGLEKTIIQECCREKKQRITNTEIGEINHKILFRTMGTANRVAECMHLFRMDRTSKS